MNSSFLQTHVDQVCDLVNLRSEIDRRTIIAIAGPPASGKSTLAEAVVERLNKDSDAEHLMASLLPMDGYHLDNSILQSRGLLDRKGAPETFDAFGFFEAVKRLTETDHELFYPTFNRQMDVAIANSMMVHPQTPVVVVEGNYLLMNSVPWNSLIDVFTATVFISPTIDVLKSRLQQRWIDHGLGPEAALQRATSNDLVNAELIIRDSVKADLILT